MHRNITLKIDGLSNKCLQHYHLDMHLGAELKTQCFFDITGDVTDITWAGQILTGGKPYWNDFKALINSGIESDQLAKDIAALGKATEYQSIQSMHDLAEKHCSGVDITC